jgi:hypothetical protein
MVELGSPDGSCQYAEERPATTLLSGVDIDRPGEVEALNFAKADMVHHSSQE